MCIRDSVYPARDLLWATMLVDPVPRLLVTAAECCFVGVEAGTDPGPAPMLMLRR